MDEIKLNPILKFNENHLQNVRKALGYEDLNRLKQDIEQFENWIKKQSHFRVKEFERGYLERLLIYNKGSIERAKKRFDKLCTCMNLMPEYLLNFDIKHEFTPLFKVSDTCILPTPTNDNYRVLFIVVNGEEDDDYQLIMFYRYLLVLGHYLLTHDYCQGFEVVGDLRKITLNNAKKFNPIVVHKAVMLLTECMGQRIKRMHLFNDNKFFDMVFYLLKQGVTAKIRERIVLHPNFESLYEYIPREQLPKDYGGDDLIVKELAELNFREISSDEHIANIKHMEQAATDESCRLDSTFNEEYSGVPGSFKTLCVD